MFKMTKKLAMAVAKNRNLKGRHDMNMEQLVDELQKMPATAHGAVEANVKYIAQAYGLIGYHALSVEDTADLILSKDSKGNRDALENGFSTDLTDTEVDEYESFIADADKESRSTEEKRDEQKQRKTRKKRVKKMYEFVAFLTVDGPKQIQSLVDAAQAYATIDKAESFTLDDLGSYASAHGFLKTKQSPERIAHYYRKQLLDLGVIAIKISE
jgi:hypothetical protein